ncbi:MAG: hypothetical protein AVDCRST_MAG49-2636 [uncultured Thermomicrobiales bacterium]|uniref:Uncharacterized protein n=1 Tax=uncultured Thermomicrobiales bacterium TaxID=1645740 RepID=A0A6J4UWN1_9BACT|nr:MAG: hypothetical protein AVDCRST_MAG49-2636 [uncultured Thermomicrobiales bacterium]
MAPSAGETARAGQAGFLAALVMLGAQLLWRTAAGSDAPAFPEIVVAAVARLTPLDVFAAATETYGSLAKRALFVAALLGVAATAAAAAVAAAGVSGRTGRDLAGQLRAAGIVAAGLLLVVSVLFSTLPPAAPTEGFPSGLLWGFRLSSFGTQLVFWAGLGALFGLLCERANRRGGTA